MAGVAANRPKPTVDIRLDDNYGWDDGLIACRMKMLVDPVARERSLYFENLQS